MCVLLSAPSHQSHSRRFVSRSSSQADLWAEGVVSYMLLSASKPFMHKRRRKMIDLIMRADYNFDAPVWDGISAEAKDFVASLLVIDPKLRLDAKQALDHPWIVNREQLKDEVPPEEVLLAMPESLVRYKDSSSLKKLALNVIAHRSTSDEILHLRKTFEAYDTERNGVISYEEFKAALEKAEYSEDSLQEIFESIDVNNNGHINYTEFLAGTSTGQIFLVVFLPLILTFIFTIDTHITLFVGYSHHGSAWSH